MKRIPSFSQPKAWLSLLLSILVVSSAVGQINRGGEPLNWGSEVDCNLVWNTFEALDVEALETEDAVTATMKDADVLALLAAFGGNC